MGFPMLESFKAIESSRKDDDIQWLSYWVVFSAFRLFETLFGIVLAWIPLYGLARLAFVAWLAMPQTRGATYLYKEFVRPLLLVVVEKGRSVPQLAPYFAGFGGASAPAKAVEAVKDAGEAVAAAAEESFAPLKAHAQ